MVARQPKGIPVGGQYAENAHDEAPSGLDKSWEDKSEDERKHHVTTIIDAVLAQHGVHGWSTRFTQNRTSLGEARFSKRTISISTKLFEVGLAETMDTALHECAHVIAGPSAAHGPEWKRVARRLGARPVSATDIALTTGREGDEQSVSTRYGDLTLVEGESQVVYKGKTFTLAEVRRDKAVVTDPAGRRSVLPLDVFHPNYGDISKMTNGKTATMTTDSGARVTATEGETTFEFRGEQYVVTEIRRKNFVGVSPSGARFLFAAHRLDPTERDLATAFAEYRKSKSGSRS